MFDLDHFIEDCRATVTRNGTHKAAVEVLEKALDDRSAVTDVLAREGKAGIFPLYRSEDLTILNILWKPGMTVPPHNHDMWAAIGIYTGREDNIFWRRIADDAEGRIEAAGAKSLAQGQVAPLGKDIVHSVTNPLGRLTGGIHVYGGDFFDAHKSAWEPEDLTEQPYDPDKIRAMFKC
ncbi:MAG: hypothetical protein AAF674_06070 [Pseudomonadota bacterium]